MVLNRLNVGRLHLRTPTAVDQCKSSHGASIMVCIADSQPEPPVTKIAVADPLDKRTTNLTDVGEFGRTLPWSWPRGEACSTNKVTGKVLGIVYRTLATRLSSPI